MPGAPDDRDGDIPPFEIVAIAFAIAFVLCVGKWVLFREDIAGHLRQPPAVWLLGVGGLFGYHSLYFAALKLAPPVEANLINYLWPLLIVLFSALLPGERLRWAASLGALLGFAGVVLLAFGRGVSFTGAVRAGYALALGCAVVWSLYSVLSRRFGRRRPTPSPPSVRRRPCCRSCHLVFERTVWPSPAEWGVLVLMGLGPTGLAFFVWDVGMKRGNIKALGGLSYATPLLSTLLLILAGRASPSVELALACLFIVGGAVLASRDLWARTTPSA